MSIKSVTGLTITFSVTGRVTHGYGVIDTTPLTQSQLHPPLQSVTHMPKPRLNTYAVTYQGTQTQSQKT